MKERGRLVRVFRLDEFARTRRPRSVPELHAFALLPATFAHFCIDNAPAQNIVERAAVTFSANPERLTEKEVSEFIFSTLAYTNTHEDGAALSLLSPRLANSADAGHSRKRL